MDSESLQLRDLVPAEPFIQSPGWPWWAWAIVAVLAIGLALLIRQLFKKRDEEAGPDLRHIADEAYRIACDKIDLAANLTAIQDVATSCSEAVRRYLATVTKDPSLFETHEEFLSRHQALADFPSEIRQQVSKGFSHLARLKYGKSVSGEASTITQESRALLQSLHQRRPA